MNDKEIRKRLFKRDLLVITMDLCIVSFCFLITTWGRFDFSIHDLIIYGFQMNLYKAICVLIVYLFSFYLFKVYKSLWKYTGFAEAKNICYSVLLATGILLSYTFLFNFKTMLINIILVSGMLTILAMFSIRAGYRMYRTNLLEHENKTPALIIGAGDAGYILLKELQQTESKTIDVIGFVDDFKNGMIVSGKNVLGRLEDIPNIVERYKVKLIYFAIPSANSNLRKRAFAIIEPLNIKTKIVNSNVVTLKNGESFSKHLPLQDISIEDLLGRGEIKLEQSEIKSYLSDKVILVTGAGGSIGSELCRQIVKYRPSKLIMLDINENSLYMLEQEFNRMRNSESLDKTIEIKSIIASVRDEKSIDELFKYYRPTTVFHAAAHKHVPLMETAPKEAIKNNVFGTENVIKSCINNQVERFIMISTDKAVNPTNVMGATKRITELLLEAYRNNGVTKVSAVRFGNVLGSNGSVIPIFKEQIKSGGPVTITDKNIIRYFMTIPEAAQLVLQAGFYANKGEIFVLDMGKPVKILDLAEKMIKLAGYEPYKDIDIIEIGLRSGEKMFEELHLDSEVVSKTKNDLIFVNKPVDISMITMNHILKELDLAISESDVNIKTILLEKIKDFESQVKYEND